MNKSKIVLFRIFITVLIMANLSVAQSKITTESINVRHGLSSNSIRDIIQDDSGYLWLATADGINIYDGYNVSVFKSIPGDSTSLPSNDVFRFYKDKQGTMWIGTLEGFSEFNSKNNSFATYRPNEISTGVNAHWTLGFCEDSRGNLWVGYSDGCAQFNRVTKKFQRFDVMLTDNSLRSFTSNVDVIIENETGELYAVSSVYGLLKFDYDAQIFIQVPLEDDFNSKLINNRYWDRIIDNDNNLWLGSFNGLYKIDLTMKQGYDLTPYKKVKSNTIFDNAATALIVDRDDNIWVGTGINGLYLYHTKEKKFEQLISKSPGLIFEGFYEDKSGILWLGTQRGVLKYDFDRKPFETFSISANVEQATSQSVLAFSESNVYKNNIWLGTVNGLHLFDNVRNTFISGDKKNKNLSKISDLRINAVVETENKDLWLATRGEGLFLFDLQTGKLKNYRNIDYNHTSLIHNRIRALHLDSNKNLWIGTQWGLELFEKNSENFVTMPSLFNRMYDQQLLESIVSLRESKKVLSSIINTGDYADITNEFVLREDRKVLIYSMGEGLPEWNMVDFGWLESGSGDTLWNAGEFDESFYAGGNMKNRLKIGLFELKRGRYKLRYKTDDSHSAALFNAAAPQDSTFWGTQIFRLEDDEFKTLKALFIESEEITYMLGQNIRFIFSDSDNNIWAGTSEGLSKIDSGFNIQNFIHNQEANALSNNSIWDVNEDLYGNLWIATSDGLNRFDPSTGQFTILREIDGLPSSNVSAIEVDNSGNLWVSGIKGISKVELDENGNKQIIVNYDVKDGLQGYEFNRNASLKDKTGKLYFAGLDGVNAFYPGNSNKTPPLLSLKSVKVSNKSLQDINEDGYQNLQHLSELSLSHVQNDLAFEFASIHFSRPDKNRLLYKMDGIDEAWQIGDRRFASYTNLDPGDYTFRFRGSNGDGIWSDETRTIQIHIAAPWYNNWMAYAVYIALFFGMLIGIRRFEIRRQQKNTTIKESHLRAEAAELKAKAAEAQAQVVQAENERKSKELEEARALQLSMLPRELPQLPNLDIAVYMKTATEVGGDYYDFHVSMDGTLTVVVGDATGHGMKAGTMVTAAKSLFNSYAPNPDILFTFQEITRCIKQMNFDRLSMCMTMVKIQGNKLLMSAAGMPPSFIYRRDTRSMEEHLLKGMPLGTMEKFPYQVIDRTLMPGDTILLISDGLPELNNAGGEMYGYKRVRNSFEDVADKSPEDIVRTLKDESAAWVNNHDPDDDVTFVVIKVK